MVHIMLRLRYWVVIILVLMLGGSALGQGDYFRRGTSGFEIDAGFVTNTDWSGLFSRAGYCVSGAFDFGLLVAFVAHDRKVAGEDVRSTTFAPFFRWFVVKQQQNRFPVSLSISARYSHDSYSSDGLDVLDQKMESDFFSFGVSAHRVTSNRSNLMVQPHVSLVYRTGELEISRRLNEPESEDDSDLIVQTGLSLFFKRSSRSVFRLEPTLSITSDDVTLSVNFGLIFPTIGR